MDDDLLRRWIVAANEWKKEATRLANENTDLRERHANLQAAYFDLWRQLNS